MTDLLIGLSFTIGSFFILCLLFVVYYFQDRRTGLRADMFKYAIMVNAILIISELVSSYLLYDKYMPVLGEIILKFHWYTGVAYFFCFYFYADAYLKNVTTVNKKEYFLKDIGNKIYLIITILFSLVYFIVQFKDLNYYELSYLPGMPAYIVFGYATITVLITLFKYIKRKEKTKNEILFIVLFLTGPTIDLLLQLKWETIAFSPMITTFVLLGCYFLLENPDLYIANELNQSKKELEYISNHKKDVIIQKTKNITEELYRITDSNYNCINISEKNNYKISVSNNIDDLKDIIKNTQNLFNILIMDEKDNKLDEGEYKTDILLTKLFYRSINKARNKKVQIIFDIDQFMPTQLYGDKDIIFQVLLYAMNIAIKNTEVGKITLKIDCNFSSSDVQLNISVSDTGIGFKDEEVIKLNNPNIADNSIENIENYCILKQFVTYLNGRYKVTSNYGVGTTISISFIQNLVTESRIGEFKPVQIKYDNNLSNRKILILDKNPDNLIYYINKYKINYETVQNFDECISKLKQDDTFTTVFINPNLAQNDNNAIKSLKSIMAQHQNVVNKVIAISSNSLSGTMNYYLSLGYDYFLDKPYDEYDINEIITKI